MKKRRCLGLLLVILFLVCCVRLAAAQTRGKGSHIPIPGIKDSADAEKIFEERLRQLGLRSKEYDQIPEAIRKLLTDESFKKWVEQLKKDGINPKDERFAEQVKQYIAQQSKGTLPKLSPEEMKNIQELAQKLFPNGAMTKLPPINPDTGKSAVKNPLDPPNPSLNPPPNPSTAGKRPAEKIDEEALAQARRQLSQFTKRMEGWANKVEDSPALQQAVRDLAKNILDMQGQQLPSDDRLDVQLANLNRLTQDTKHWLKDSWRSMQKLDMPDLPNDDWWKLDLSAPTLPTPNSLPNLEMPHGIGAVQGSAAGWQTVLAVIVLVLLGLTLLKLGGRLPGALGKSRSTWKLGPWPMNPNQVASRADLVRTFEYLSLLRLGYAVRSANHHDIADQLGSRADQRQAALDLAALYERARYTPEDEPLPADALAAARRDLCFLAGVPAV